MGIRYQRRNVAIEVFSSVSAVLACAGTLASVAAQSQSAGRPEFAVASIKANHSIGGATFGAGNGGGGGRNVTLKALMAFAYRVQEFQISGGPGWIGSERFDVQSKAEDPRASFDQLRLLLQSLVADRFQVKFHRETKVLPIYALVVAKGGAKVRLSEDQQSPEVNGPAPPGSGPNRGAVRIGAGSLTGNAVTMSLFTRFLSQRLDRTILDRTKLAGRFDIQLQWTPGPGEMPYGPSGDLLAAAESSGASVFVAIQEQLGLKLEPARGPVEVFVIDHAEGPSEN
jgi:uncharacterized protein (TIGR03435 family)